MASAYDQLYGSNPAYTKDAYGTYRDQSGSVMYDNAGAQPGQAATMNSGMLAGVNFNGGGWADPSQGVTNNTDTMGQYNTKPMTQPSGGFTAGGTTTGTQNNSYGGGMGSGGGSMGGQNPYLQSAMDGITNQVTTNFNRNVMPQISSQMMASGGYGGSRQGVIEANAMRDMNQGLSNSLANLGLQDFNAQRGYDLGLRGNDLGFAGLDAQINQNNFNNNLAGAQFGQGVWNQGMANNQAGITAGTNIQNTPQNYWSQFGNQFNSIGQGYGSTTGSSSQQGNPMMSMLGGAQLGGQLGNQFANWMGGSANAAGGANSQGWGTGSGYGNQDYGSFI